MLPFDHVEQRIVENSVHLTYAILHEDGDYFFLAQAKLISGGCLIEITYNLDGNGDFHDKKIKYSQLSYYLKKFYVLGVSIQRKDWGVSVCAGEMWVGANNNIITTALFSRLTGTYLN
ncbi:hypothetical protein OAQ85_00070 [Schleiferiaceae bacterium]|jgi:hypothetical protein|nr:hypothetical protein [Flavobacteriales bacterium]MDC1021808.1 hypothetical protein [Schleiferiaceae bacterium]|tara:strand:- start:8196 stop:8549 length:354 start_codon:yes stop_codon:yes gene_type:complete